ncbi:hypothetical protein ADUPG1_012421, partial [Aduncisulcus paluster]
EEGKASGEIAKHLKTRVLPLLEEYRSKIKSRGSIPASVEPFSIRLVPGEKFVLSSGRRINHAHRGFLKDEIKRLKEARLIVPSMSPFYSPVVIVPKKNGKKRLCIDYRVLNSITVPFQFPLPRIDEILDSLEGRTVFGTLDFSNGFHLIPIDPDCQLFTAFRTPCLTLITDQHSS